MLICYGLMVISIYLKSCLTLCNDTKYHERLKNRPRSKLPSNNAILFYWEILSLRSLIDAG
jgi:hypothetical protein